jgi:cytoskeletal protein RodZ
MAAPRLRSSRNGSFSKLAQMSFLAIAMFLFGCAFENYRAGQTSTETSFELLNVAAPSTDGAAPSTDCEKTSPQIREAENKTAETSPQTAENPNSEKTIAENETPPGWKSIEVFYGNTQYPKQKNKRKWFSQSKQE